MVKQNKIYAVCGAFDSAAAGALDDVSIWMMYFKTKEEAEEACKIVEDFYTNRCEVACTFEVREIDLDEFSTIESLKEDLEDEYDNCWNPNM